ncbi:MAG: hypothetical protein HY244_13900 [Rhizobiales bacterium]|nr:hypothetical protein [Hyphomicrobiales bacterium]
MDFWIVYNGFLLNDGLPQEYFDHPGYLNIVLLSGWLRLLHAAGVLDVISLSAIPPVSDAVNFAKAWTYATQAGRVLSLALAIAFVIAFAYLLRRLVRDWRIATLGVFLLAFSGGLEMEMRIIRTELIAGGLIALAFLIVIVAARSERSPWRPILIGVASLLAMLAMLNKVQVIFLICALPLVALPFGSRPDRPSGFWNGWRGWLAAALLCLLAVLAAMPATALIKEGWDPTIAASFGLRPLIGGRFGVYQFAIGGWIVLGMLAYAFLWRVAVAELLATVAATVYGAALGLLVLYVQHNPHDVAVVMNPLEQMYVFAVGSTPELAQGNGLLSGQHIQLVLSYIVDLAARRTFVLHSSPRPTIFLEWFVIAATIFAWRRGERKLVLQAGALMLTVWGVDLIGMARDLKLEYFILTDPLVVIAAALLMMKLVQLHTHAWAYPVGAALIVAHVAVSQAEPVKHVFKKEGPEVYCGLYHHAKRVEQFSFCRKS